MICDFCKLENEGLHVDASRLDKNVTGWGHSKCAVYAYAEYLRAVNDAAWLKTVGKRWKRPGYDESVTNKKLTESQVVAIRQEYAMGGVTMTQLGAKYDVHPTTIALIVKRKTWAHV